MTMRRLLLLLSTAALLFVGGTAFQSQYDRWEARGGERVVAALPGVGTGWLDTLRRVAGDVQVDTISKAMLVAYAEPDDGTMLGAFEPWHNLISVRADMKAYLRYIRQNVALQGSEYAHPLTTASPAGVVAHEFGHLFQANLWPHGEVREGGDSLPSWAQDQRERFADRFARAMLALRGWDAPDPSDSTLNEVVRSLLVASYHASN